MQCFVAGCLAALLSPTVPLGNHTAQENVQDFVTGRQFDLRHIALALPRQELRATEVGLLPMMRSNRSDHIEEFNSSECIERLLDLFLTTHEEAFETVEIMDSGHVYLEGTPEALAEFDVLVKKFSSILASRPTVEVIEVTFPEGVEPQLPAQGAVSRARIQTWIEAGAKLSIRQVQSSSYTVQRVADLQAHPVFVGIDCEIASTSGIFDPDLVDIVTGSDLMFKSHRVGDELEISYQLRNTLRQDVEGTTSRAEIRVFHESGRVEFLSNDGWAESFGVTGGAVAGQARIREGEYLALVINGATGQTRCTLIGAAKGGFGGPALRSLANYEHHSALVLPMALAESTARHVHWSDGRTDRTLEVWANEIENNEWRLWVETEQNEESLLNRLLDAIDVTDRLNLGDQHCFLLETSEVERFKRYVRAAEAQSIDQFNVTVTSQDAHGRRGRGGTLSLMSGSKGALVAGQERIIAKEVNVEVAQNVATRGPVTRIHFEGLGLAIELSGGPDGMLSYRASGQLTTDLSVDDSMANESANMNLQAITTDRLVIDQSGIVTSTDGKTWTILFGDTSRAGSYVELNVTRQ